MNLEAGAQDRELVQRVLAGDPSAGREFAARMAVVGRILAARNADYGRPLGHEDLADLTQDTLLAIWRRLPEYEGRARLESWVYRFCALELLTALRRRGERSLPASDHALEPVDGRGSLATGEVELSDYLRLLAAREAEVVRLRHVEELEFAEIAEVLAISPSSAKTHYYRALEKLRQAHLARAEESR